MERKEKEQKVEEIDLDHFVKEARKTLSINKPSLGVRCIECPGNLPRCIHGNKIPS